MKEVPYAVEGKLDRSVILILFKEAQLVPSSQRAPQWTGGRSAVLEWVSQHLVASPNKAAVALVDLDGSFTGFSCAGAAKQAWLNQEQPNLCFRIAVQEIEAWLLADMEGIIKFLSVSDNDYHVIVGDNPDALQNPKLALCQLANRSSNQLIKRAIRVRTNDKDEGPAYTGKMIEFVKRHWNPNRAAQRSDSLKRCLNNLKRMSGASH